MPHFDTSQTVPHPAAAMFDLVADMERYPEFVPLCERLTIRSRQGQGDRTLILADMRVGYKMVSETFTSSVTLDRDALTIRAENIDGPFRSMENVWTFTPRTDTTSKIAFRITYEFRSRTLALLMGSMFDRVFRAYERAFVTRADTIYGTHSPPRA